MFPQTPGIAETVKLVKQIAENPGVIRVPQESRNGFHPHRGFPENLKIKAELPHLVREPLGRIYLPDRKFDDFGNEKFLGAGRSLFKVRSLYSLEVNPLMSRVLINKDDPVGILAYQI